MTCTNCHHGKAEWDFGKENLCQMCFEDLCSEEYWKAFNQSPDLFVLKVGRCA